MISNRGSMQWLVILLVLVGFASGAEGEPGGEAKIHRALQGKVSVDFAEVPLTQALAQFEQQHQFSVVINRPALANAGVKPDLPVTLAAKGIRLESALNLMLKPHGLAWTVRDEVLLVTSKDDAEALFETRVYPVAELVGNPEANLGGRFDELLNVITSTVEPSSWDTVGGKGAIRRYGETLVIYQASDVHHRVDRLLHELGRHREPPAASEPAAESEGKP